MNSVKKLVLSMAALAILASTSGVAQARKEVTQEQYIRILTCMKNGNSNAVCVRMVLDGR